MRPIFPKSFRASRLLYIAVWLIGGIYALLVETSLLPEGYAHPTPTTLYVLSLICVVLTLGATWSMLRLFAFKAVKRRLQARPETLPRLAALRVIVMAIVILLDLLTYYAFLDTSLLYCLLIALVGFIFCWPQEID